MQIASPLLSSLLFPLLAVTAVAPAFSAELIRTVRDLPKTQEEARREFESLQAYVVLPMRAGEPLRTLDLSAAEPEKLGLQAKVRIGSRELPVPMARRTAMSLGMVIQAKDQDNLPSLSASTIRARVNRQFVCMQALIRRDLDTGKVCLHDRVCAAQLFFDSPRITEDFETLIRLSLGDTRSLGLFSAVDPRTLTEPPRTLVLLSRNGEKLLEYAFVHARPHRNVEGNDDLELHVFSTSSDMTKLKYLPPFRLPESPLDCDLVGSIYFTRYAADGLTPIAAVVRSVDVKSRAEFEVDRLNEFVQQEKRGEHYLEHLSDVLDAVIDGKIKN